jgi:5'-nucleotidase
VVALAHLRTVRDLDLATIEDIDLVLGGHDHEYEVSEVNHKKIVKSGVDFKEFSEVTLHFDVTEEEASLAKE